MSKTVKSNSRRGPPGLIASIQFDKLISDAGKRPIASKSAGVVGKWGTTSFTSLRSSHVNSIKAGKWKTVRFQDIFLKLFRAVGSAVKGSLADGASNYSQGNTENKPSALTQPSDPKAEPSAPKPRKFFKSRATDNQESANKQSNVSLDIGSSLYEPFPTTAAKNQSNSADKYSLAPQLEPVPTRTTRGRAKNANFSVDLDDEEVEAKKPRAGRRGKNKNTQPPPPPPVSQRMTRTKRKLEKLELEEHIEQDDPYKEQAKGNSPVKVYNTNRNTEKKEAEPAPVNVPTTPEECKPPIKLRIIRQNDKSAFVTSLSSDECEKKPEFDSPNDAPSDVPDNTPTETEEPIDIPESEEKVSLPEATSDPVIPPEGSPKVPVPVRCCTLSSILYLLTMFDV